MSAEAGVEEEDWDEVDAVLVDEASMLDLPLAAALLQALPSHCQLVFVGRPSLVLQMSCCDTQLACLHQNTFVCARHVGQSTSCLHSHMHSASRASTFSGKFFDTAFDAKTPWNSFASLTIFACIHDWSSLGCTGDVDQLPPVGPGKVLSDAIQSGVIPGVDLREIFRQAQQSGIVQTAHAVNAGDFSAVQRNLPAIDPALVQASLLITPSSTPSPRVSAELLVRSTPQHCL